MKLSFDNFVERELAVIPLYPIASWGTATTVKNRENRGDDNTSFKEVKLELRSIPDDPTSAKFGSYFKVFERGTPEQWCRWRDDLKRAWIGLNSTNGPARAQTVRHLLEGRALDDFEQFMEATPATVENINRALKKVAAGIFPTDSVMHIKQYLMYEAKKPKKLKARDLRTRLERINSWMEYFPSDGASRLETVTRIGERELPTIFYRMLPAVWRRKMDENNTFSPFNCTLQEIVDYAERLEVTEGRYETAASGNSGTVKSGKSNGPVGRKSGNSRSDPESGDAKGSGSTRNNNHYKNVDKDCMVHGANCGHSSHNCKVLKGHAEKLHGQWKAQSPRSGNGPYKKKQDYKQKNGNNDRTYTRSEVQTLIRKMGKKLRIGDREQENNLIEVNDAGRDAVIEIDDEELDEYMSG